VLVDISISDEEESEEIKGDIIIMKDQILTPTPPPSDTCIQISGEDEKGNANQRRLKEAIKNNQKEGTPTKKVTIIEPKA
jgi:hypothetical protein